LFRTDPLPGAARKVMNAIWGMGQMLYTKMIVAVDESVDVQNLSACVMRSEKRKGRDSLFFAAGPWTRWITPQARRCTAARLGVDATENGIPAEEGIEDHFIVIQVKKEYIFQGERRSRIIFRSIRINL
jgi:4-hydroxy-3-polyprenylbenzoate decarboxylase